MGLFKRKKDEPADPDERSPELGLKYKDLAVLGKLKEAGARLDEPRHVLHFLYFTEPSRAVDARDRARGTGWQAEVREPLPEYPDSWAVVCERESVILHPDVVRESTDFFDALADELDGEYDGWEASV